MCREFDVCCKFPNAVETKYEQNKRRRMIIRQIGAQKQKLYISNKNNNTLPEPLSSPENIIKGKVFDSIRTFEIKQMF